MLNLHVPLGSTSIICLFMWNACLSIFLANDRVLSDQMNLWRRLPIEKNITEASWRHFFISIPSIVMPDNIHTMRFQNIIFGMIYYVRGILARRDSKSSGWPTATIVAVMSGDWYLRMLISRIKGPVSFESLRTIDGILYYRWNIIYTMRFQKVMFGMIYNVLWGPVSFESLRTYSKIIV